MKQGFAIFLSILLMLSFCGCRPSSSQGSTVDDAATHEPTRAEKIRLEFFLEGMPEYQDATLFVGDGYSLYITDDNWLSVPGKNGKMTWISSYNPDISLAVIPNAGDTFTHARDTLFQHYIGVADEGEYVFGHDESGNYYRAARLIETTDGILAAVWDYTLEAAEGFGARLYVIAGTLEPQ